ncbi:putative phenylalanine/histidine ammonia-lyase [Actinoplanes missouriensis 431]|uniref:Putative phenylalanine/histidine ammonia-lyase n=1 Tax=Actinoplanes missouriensis (strain ATCC 14538 / DSM 43046 / CBS 188.64 / JCM 3121 / NBRC 102363 / NCIMB 12654 / NRRL B-3342 / UNCC 431) TaxID=512565 RepID=I0HBI5_ACTM4|nr:aromatic amino acid lyase [Actinoplanes missouriensis]BAL90372.1 putative phenylalanine/histidine ammonia-lyase [Actinoplanes missouriensis 431]
MQAQDGVPPIPLDGRTLAIESLVAIATGMANITVDPAALARVGARHAVLRAAREHGAVYGANTGVGANRHESTGDSVDHGLRLLRSHCAGVGPVEDDVTARAAMIVRLNQILAGGSGVSRHIAEALAAAVHDGAVPTLHPWGAIGTADLSALAELGLTLAGERPWRHGAGPTTTIDATDALPMISSSALTVATAALALTSVQAQLRASIVVAALSFLALRGNPEAYDPAVHRARAHPQQAKVAASLQALVAGCGPAVRIQDPFGLRVVPQVTAPAVHAARELQGVLTAELNAAVENPLVTDDGVLHHGQFHTATLATALDAMRSAFLPVLSLSSARLGLLMRPDLTGLRAFLASGPPGSSGMMISEYVVQDVLTQIRVGMQPTAAGTLSISLGLEEHASFATQGARALRTMTALAPMMLAAELVAAVRALRMAPGRLTEGLALRAFAMADKALEADEDDIPLGASLEQAAALLPQLADL